MKTYSATLDDVQLIADMACQLDHVKNLLPSECGAARECAVLQARGHSTAMRMLGDDDALVYGTHNPEENDA